MGERFQSDKYFRRGVQLTGFPDFPFIKNTLLEQSKSRTQGSKANDSYGMRHLFHHSEPPNKEEDHSHFCGSKII